MTAREQSTEPRRGAGLHPGDVYGLLLLRLGLGGVLVWFGAAELHNPGAWAVFVPKVFTPVLAPLMFLHATALLVVGALMVVGMFQRLAALLGGLILAAILGALAMNGSVDSVFVRDVGLACGSFALALAPSMRLVPGIDRLLAGRSLRGYLVPALSYGALLAVAVTALAVTAVPSRGTAAAFNDLGGMNGLSSLGGSAGSSGGGGLALGGGSAPSGQCTAATSSATCAAPTGTDAGTSSVGLSALGSASASTGSASASSGRPSSSGSAH